MSPGASVHGEIDGNSSCGIAPHLDTLVWNNQCTSKENSDRDRFPPGASPRDSPHGSRYQLSPDNPRDAG